MDRMTETTPECINTLIAEKVFGQTVLHKTVWNRPLIAKRNGLTEEIPHYSTDMNAAWIALKYACLGYPEHLVDRGKLVKELFVRIQEHDEIDTRYMLGVMCAWTPEMICKAILRAYGVEIEA